MMDRDEVISRYFESVDRHLRPACFAKLTRDLRGLTPGASCFGHAFLGGPRAPWPVVDGRPLEGIVQINVAELPHTPSGLHGTALIQVFASGKLAPDAVAYDGGPWLVRSFASLADLVPLERPFKSALRACRINWTHVPNEPPHYPESLDLIDHELVEQFEALDDADALYSQRYPTEVNTKVGGWPYSLQSGASCGEYVFQVGSEEKANWMWGPDGNAFFGKDAEGRWIMSWDFL